jgi:3-carboxy-cis,cis-muconate cycloisomerase
MPEEHERGLGNWHAEWETVPEVFRLAGGAFSRAADVIGGLEVHPEAMLANLRRSNGLIFAEAVAMALAPGLGKPQAHQIVEEGSRTAVNSKRHLRDVLAESAEIRARLDPPALDALFAPKNYLGASDEFIQRVLRRAEETD